MFLSQDLISPEFSNENPASRLTGLILATKGGSIKAKDIKEGLLSLASELSGIGLAVEKC